VVSRDISQCRGAYRKKHHRASESNPARPPVREWVGNRNVASGARQSQLANPARRESLDVTLAYLKGKDAESEEA